MILGDLCAAKFVDGQWYRAKVERVSGSEATVFYMDFGNRDTIPRTKCGVLPASFSALPAFAKEYALAFMTLPPDVSSWEKIVKSQYYKIFIPGGLCKIRIASVERRPPGSQSQNQRGIQIRHDRIRHSF